MRPGDRLLELAARFRRRAQFVSLLSDGDMRICETWWTPNQGTVTFFEEATTISPEGWDCHK